jgi:hypothetical protein
VEAGEQLVFTAGAVPLDPDGRLVGPVRRHLGGGICGAHSYNV